MDKLSKKLIRLAYENPDLRPHLLPLLLGKTSKQLSDVKIDEGKMRRLLGVKKGEDISDKYTPQEATQKLVDAVGQQEAAGMINYIANLSGQTFFKSMQKALKSIPNKTSSRLNYVQAVKDWRGEGLIIAVAVGLGSQAEVSKLAQAKDQHGLKKLVSLAGDYALDPEGEPIAMCWEGSLYVLTRYHMKCPPEECDRILKVIRYQSNRAGLHYEDDLYL